MSDLPLHRDDSLKPTHSRSLLSRWRLWCTAALFGAFFYGASFHIRSLSTLRPPSALPAEQIPLLTDPRIPTRPHEHTRPSRPSSDHVSFANPVEYITDYHHLELEALHEMVGRTKGFFVRDWSLHLGWNNVRHLPIRPWPKSDRYDRCATLSKLPLYRRNC